MKTRFLQLIAQKIVDKTSPLVKARTINIMDTEGIIIASNDSDRIGQLHSGAKKAAELGQSVEIYPTQINEYVGVKEGINIPIFKSGEIIGVVGLYGNPDNVRETAALLSSTVTLLLEQYDRLELEDVKKTARDNLSALLIQGTNSHSSSIIEEFRKLRLPIKFPITPIVFKEEDDESSPFKYRIIQENLSKKGIFRSNKDLLLNFVNGLYLILYQGNLIPEKTIGLFLKVAVGAPISSIEDLPYNSLLTLRLFECNSEKELAFNNYDGYMNLFISDGGNRFRDKTVDLMVNRLSTLGSWATNTIVEYLDSDAKMNETARKLNIHKNTCRYRIEKILSTLGLQECKLLTVLFIFKLIINSVEKRK